jgi:serine/threonine protein kinase
MFLALLEAVNQLHSSSPPLAHRDIKSQNVLLADDDAPVLMDFGSVVPARYAAMLVHATRRRALLIGMSAVNK